jgi:hypothetical protein
MTPRKRLALGLTTALTTAVLAVPASAAPPPRATTTSGTTSGAVTAVPASPKPPSEARRAGLRRAELRPAEAERELRRLERQLDRTAVNEFGKRRHYLVRNRMLDAWNGWYGPTNYRHVRYTWTGTWRVKRIWDSNGSARATAAAFCGFLSRWYPAATVCMITVLAHYWMLEAAVNRAIQTRRCLITLTKRYGLLVSAPSFLAGTVRCVR